MMNNTSPTDTETEKLSREIDINRRLLFVSWVGVIVALILGSASLAYTIWSNGQASQEVLNMARRRIVDRHPTQIVDTSTVFSNTVTTTGILPLYWRIVLINNGKSNLTLVDYDLVQIPTLLSPAFDYTGMNGGLYLCGEEFAPIDLSATPIKLEPGDAVSLCPRVGVVLSPKAYQIAKLEFGNSQIEDVTSIMKHLWRQGIDIYGNEVQILGENIFSFPGDGLEQEFQASFLYARHGR